jgi:hypothetical protein
MTHQEFTDWLAGFLDASNTISDTDKETIRLKLKTVNNPLLDFTKLPKLPKIFATPYDINKVPYSTICSCHPANGGSGICGCIMGNQLVDPNYLENTNFRNTLTSELDTLINLQENQNKDEKN